jgi:molybdenum cofactor cytidylyltransferase
MGGRHKMLLPLGQEPAIRRTVRAVLDSRPREVVVVTGFQSAAVAGALDGLAIRLAVNPRYEQGQVTSMAAGVAALRQATDAVMLCLGDMVLLTGSDYRALADAFALVHGKAIVVPYFEGRQGHPVIFAASYLSGLFSEGRERGCRHLIAEYPGEVRRYATEHDRHVFDMDTPEDYTEALRRLDSTCKAPT